jgi:hypothetical protein
MRRKPPFARPGSRRRSPLDTEAEMYLRKFVAENRPTTAEVIVWLAVQWGVHYSPTGARNVLHRIGAYLPHGRCRGVQQRWRADT